MGTAQVKVAGANIRCARCGYLLTTFEPGMLYLSPDWRPAASGDVLEVPPNVVTKIQKSKRLLREGKLSASRARAQIELRPYDTREAARGVKRGAPSSAAVAWDRLPLTLRCPSCRTDNRVERGAGPLSSGSVRLPGLVKRLLGGRVSRSDGHHRNGPPIPGL